MSRPYKFPDARDRSPNNPAVLCPAERVLALYNQDSGDKAQRIANKVKVWFDHTARSQGWADIRWFKDVSTNHGAGCVMSIAVFFFGVITDESQEEDEPALEEGGEDEGAAALPPRALPPPAPR